MLEKQNYINAWEKRVGESTCHLDYNEYLKKKDLHRLFAKAVGEFDMELMSILDYGCGGALLGEFLFKKWNIGFYAGVDIAQRCVEKSIKRMEAFIEQERADIKLIDPVDNRIKVKFDFVFCLNVIQHVPDKEYLDMLLNNFNQSKSKYIVLNFRKGQQIEFAQNPYKTTYEINMANRLPLKYITKKLDQYKLIRKHAKKTDDFVLAVYECQL